MKTLFNIDLKDYNPDGKKIYRPSVRGIIFDDNNNIALIYSKKYHYYKFPGGGMEEGETQLETLAREIKEETGMTLVPGSAKEFGEVVRTQKYSTEEDDDTIFVQQNFYYTCEVEKEIGKQNLDESEKEAEFVLVFVPIDEAIIVNASFRTDKGPVKEQMVEREKRVLEIVKETR